MKTVALFGPHHGKTFEVDGLSPSAEYFLSDEAGVRYQEFTYGRTPPEPAAMRICVYSLMDTLSDDFSGDDCAIYVHAPSCRNEEAHRRHDVTKGYDEQPHIGRSRKNGPVFW